jgi:hypothetical protein
VTLIKINCESVFKQGEKYKKYSEEFTEVKNTLKEIEDGIKAAWTSDENVNLLADLEDHINYMDNFIGFTENKGEVLKNVSTKHDESEKEFIKQMERSDLKDEYRN